MSGPIEPSDYLLGELTDSERAEAERLLGENPDFRARVDRRAPVVGALRELPAEAWDGLRAAGSEQSAPLPPSRPDRKPRRRPLSLRPAFAALAAAAFLAAGIGIGTLLDGGEEPAVRTASSLDLRPVSTMAASSQGTARLDGEEGRASVRLSGMPASRAGEYYELWLLDGPGKLVSLGSFRVPESGEARVEVPMPVDPQLFKFVDISVERLDEGPEHSGLSVMRART